VRSLHLSTSALGRSGEGWDGDRNTRNREGGVAVDDEDGEDEVMTHDQSVQLGVIHIIYIQSQPALLFHSCLCPSLLFSSFLFSPHLSSPLPFPSLAFSLTPPFAN
jgi:hypothetical protein